MDYFPKSKIWYSRALLYIGFEKKKSSYIKPFGCRKIEVHLLEITNGLLANVKLPIIMFNNA